MNQSVEKLALGLVAGLFLMAGYGPAFAVEIKCQIDKTVADGKTIEVPVTVISGAIVIEDQEVEYGGRTVTARYQLGDKFEPQTRLQMKIGDFVSSTYNVSEASLYHLTIDDLRFQCGFE